MQHRWHIEDREYRRHEARRGRRHAFEQLDPARTALVVVDLVPFFVQENPYCAGIVPTVELLAAAVRRSGGTVAWVVPGPEAPTPARIGLLGPEVAERYRLSGGTGPLPDRVWHELTVADDDLVVEKLGPSAFFPGRCSLPAMLTERGIDTVLVAGTVANVCCESTARDAATLGHRVVMVADAVAAIRDRDLNATLHTIYRSFGDVRPAADVIRLLTAGAGSAGDRPLAPSGEATVPVADPSAIWPVSVKAVVGWDDAVVLVHNERDEWELPGGRLEPGESPEQAVVRELAEEVGLTATVDRLLDAQVYQPVPGRSVLVVAYACRAERPERLAHSAEHDGVALHPAGRVDELALPPEYRRAIARWRAGSSSAG